VPEVEIEILVVSGDESEQSLQIVNSGVTGVPGFEELTHPAVAVTSPLRSNSTLTGQV
jgi:hypothetical protein